MASVKVLKRRFGGYTHAITIRIVSQDVGANRSRISYEYKVTRDTSAQFGAWTELNNVTFHLDINGVDYNHNPNFDFRVRKSQVMLSGQQTINHNSNGSKTIEINASSNALPGSVQFVASSQSGDMPLTSIPRATTPTVSPNPITIGQTVTINLPRASSAFTHTVVWETATGNGTIANDVTTSVDWTPDASIMAGAQQRGVTIKARTYDGGDLLGVRDTDLIVFAAPPDPVFPVIGTGKPYDIQFRRTELVGGDWVIKEEIPYAEANFTDSYSATGTCSITVPHSVYDTDLENAVVDLQVYDGEQWIHSGLRFVLTRVEEDQAEVADVAVYSGMSYVDFLLGKGVTPSDYEWDGDTDSPGDVMLTYIDHAHDRGWGPLLDYDFSRNRTSIGTVWHTQSVEMSVSEGTPFLQILDGFVQDVLAEYRTEYHDGKAWLVLLNPGTGSDWAVQGASPIVDLSTTALHKVADRAPTRKDYAGLLTRVRVKGEEATRTREKSSSVNPIFGHLEGSVNATGVKKNSRLDQLGDAALKNQSTATVERTFRYDLSGTHTPNVLYPYRTFRPGDWILVPSDEGPVRVRVAQVAITRSVDETTATITVGDMIPSGVAAVARRLTQQSSGAIPGGTLASPDPLASAIPAAPDNLEYVADGFWDPTGAPKASILLTWDEVTESLEGSAIDVNLYEIWSRPELGSPWTLLGLSDTNSVTVSPLDINQTMDIQVRARSVAGVFGEFTDLITVTTPEPDETLPAPSDPLLEADALGNVGVTWNGLLDGNPPPLWFSYVRAEISDASDGAYSHAGQQLSTGGTITVPQVGAGTWWFRLVPYDTLGVAGAPSNPVSILVEPVAPDTRQPNSPTNLQVTSGGYWTGPTPEAEITATWDPVTTGVDGDPITVVLYEVWGRLDEDTTPVLLTSSTDTNATYAPIGPIGSTWQISVRAMAANNEMSDFSPEVPVVIAEPAITLDPPTVPNLESWRGLLIVAWDGNLLGLDDESEPFAYPAPSYMTHVDVWVSVDEGATFDRVASLSPGTRTQAIDSLGIGTTVRVHLVAVDRLNRESPASEYAEIDVVGIDGEDIIADTISGNQIMAGSIGVNHVAPGFGDDLDISANNTVSIIAGQVAEVQADSDENASELAAMRTRYDFTPTEAVISQPGSAFSVAISNTQLEFREGGVARAYLNAGVFTAPRMASGQLVLLHHELANDPNGTVLRRL